MTASQRAKGKQHQESADHEQSGQEKVVDRPGNAAHQILKAGWPRRALNSARYAQVPGKVRLAVEVDAPRQTAKETQGNSDAEIRQPTQQPKRFRGRRRLGIGAGLGHLKLLRRATVLHTVPLR